MMEYGITHIVYGYPSGNQNVVSKIDNFIKNLRFSVSETIVFVPIDEHFSSTQASVITGDLGHKHISQDAVSAMVLLERRMETQSPNK